MVSTYYGRLISPQTSEPLTQTIYAFCLIQHQHSLESFKTKQQHQKKIKQACREGNFSCQQYMDSGKRCGELQCSVTQWAGETTLLTEKIGT